MSCVAGIVEDGKIWMGGDSAGTTDDGLQYSCLRSKVFHNGEVLIGSVGDGRVQDLFENHEMPDIPLGLGAIWHVVTWMEVILASEQPAKEGSKLAPGCMVGVRGELFVVSENYNYVQPRQGYWAIGSAGEIALGSLYATAEDGDMSIEDRIEMALAASAEFHSTVRAPFTILSL